MICKQIELCDFRNIERASLSFCDGVNVLYGDNAQGKTNLLEAIYFAAIGKSFRTGHIPEVIRFERDGASVSLDFEGAGREQNITLRLFRNRAKAVEKNRVRISKLSELVGAFRAVLFCPEHLSLIKDGPSERRQFLDIAISTMEPLYLLSLQRYEKILKQRNALIRRAQESGDRAEYDKTVEVWSEQLAEQGAFLARSRKRYITRAEAFLKECFRDMTGTREEPALLYSCQTERDGVDYEDLAALKQSFFRMMTAARERELAAGTTLYGVHKDDMQVLLNSKEARLYCSQGQQRSLALALKIAEGEITREDCGEYPVFLFDDVLSELDRGRREYLLDHVKKRQVIMTTCEQDGALAAHRIFVQEGRYEKK